MPRPHPISFLRLPSSGWRYRLRGWKYQLKAHVCVRTEIHPAAGRGAALDEWIRLSSGGWLLISGGYAWDGPSGPAIDTANFMRASVVHDALYQLIREGHLDRSWRKGADMELRRFCLQDGMHPVRAWWVYWGVRLFAGFAIKRSKGKQ